MIILEVVISEIDVSVFVKFRLFFVVRSVVTIFLSPNKSSYIIMIGVSEMELQFPLHNDTSRKIQRLIDKVASKSGNSSMIDGNVPPHITIAAFHTNEERRVIELLEDIMKDIQSGVLTFASIGVFKSSVIYL